VRGREQEGHRGEVVRKMRGGGWKEARARIPQERREGQRENPSRLLWVGGLGGK
jgi:hypothetical protein